MTDQIAKFGECKECGKALVRINARHVVCPDGHGRLIPFAPTKSEKDTAREYRNAVRALSRLPREMFNEAVAEAGRLKEKELA